MPTFTLNTNVEVKNKPEVLAGLSQLCASMLGKPESYVMVHINDLQAISFAGTTEPAATCSLVSLGMSDQNTGNYSANLCEYLENELGIPAGRCYIEFRTPDRAMFGWNNSTF